jgi:hypothetical protein
MSRVHPVQAPGAVASVREVRAQRTPTAPPRIRAAIASAWHRDTGAAAAPALLDVLTAQVSHETARGQAMYNHNFGGIKGAGPGGATARYQTREILGGEEHHLVDGFRAYRSVDEGALDYVQTLRTRYPSAVAAAARGDVDGFASALKKSGYFTAHLSDYAASLRALVHEGPGAAPAAAAAAPLTVGSFLPVGDFVPAPESVVQRVMDAVAAMGARVGAPLGDSDPEWTRKR